MSLRGVFALQSFDFSRDKRLLGFIGKSIRSVELIAVENDTEPFGVMINLDSDSLIVVPISDGSTVITSQFGNRSALECFKHLG